MQRRYEVKLALILDSEVPMSNIREFLEFAIKTAGATLTMYQGDAPTVDNVDILSIRTAQE